MDGSIHERRKRVTFFASGLATGGLNNSAGDQVYTYSRTLLEPPSLEWNSSVGGVIFSSPAISSDGTVYAGSNDNKLHAFNSDGSTKWTFTTGNWVDSTPAIGSDGTVYAGSWDNKLYALDPTNGSKLWDFNTSSSITASPAIGSNGNLYFGSKDYFFYALDSSGNKLWEYFAGQPVSSSAALGQDGTIYFGDENGTFHAVNPDGSEKWTYVVEGRLGHEQIHSLLSCPRSFRKYLFWKRQWLLLLDCRQRRQRVPELESFDGRPGRRISRAWNRERSLFRFPRRIPPLH